MIHFSEKQGQQIKHESEYDLFAGKGLHKD